MSVLGNNGSHQSHVDQIDRIDTIIDLITYDDRPTLILDTTSRRIRFCNIAFDWLVQENAASTDLQSWLESVCAVAINHATHEPIHLGTFAQQEWQGKSLGTSIVTVFCRWTPVPVIAKGDAIMTDHDEDNNLNDTNPSETQRITDMHMGWLEPRDDPWMSFVRNFPFHETALGPISNWHPQLRRAVQRMMVCPETRILYWGDKHAMLYNEAAVPILGKQHPCLGMPLVETWGQVMYDQIDATIKAVVVSGKAQQMRNIMFEMQRDDILEQTWHHFYQLPIIGHDGRYLGCVCEFAENTTGVVQENRSAILDMCIRSAASAPNLNKLWSASLDSFSKNSIDIAAGCVFSIPNIEDHSQSSQSPSKPQDYVLEASFGLTNPQSTLSPSLLKMLNRSSEFEKLVVLRKADDSLPSDLQWNTPDRGTLTTLCILPITDLNDRRLAVCVFGMNPGRPFDQGSRSYISRIGDVLRKSAVFITLPEEQKKIEAITSALSDKLSVALLSAEIQEESYARMARTAPIGMYMLRPDGYPIFVNDAFLELHGVTRAKFYQSADQGLGWDPTVHDDDKDHVTQM
jgi:PAS domain-containing protein